jgi:hypothetical protein
VSKKPRFSLWRMIRDIVVTAIVKGQFPLVLFGFCVVIVLLKLPQRDISYFVRDFYLNLKEAYLVGYVLFGITTLGWFFHARYQRKLHAAEIDRIASDKSKLQEKLLGKKLKSAKK